MSKTLKTINLNQIEVMIQTIVEAKKAQKRERERERERESIENQYGI